MKFIVSSDSRVRNQYKNFTRFGSIDVEHVTHGDIGRTMGGIDVVRIQTNYLAGVPASMMSLTLEDAEKLINALKVEITAANIERATRSKVK